MKRLQITTPLNTEDYTLFKEIIEQGIDGYLEGFTDSEFAEKMYHGQPRLVMEFGSKDLPILVRRLKELDNDDALLWANDIEETEEYKALKD